jgi:hypothetical protein
MNKAVSQSLVGLMTKGRILFQPFLRSPHGVTRRGQLLGLKKSSRGGAIGRIMRLPLRSEARKASPVRISKVSSPLASARCWPS